MSARVLAFVYVKFIKYISRSVRKKKQLPKLNFVWLIPTFRKFNFQRLSWQFALIGLTGHVPIKIQRARQTFSHFTRKPCRINGQLSLPHIVYALDTIILYYIHQRELSFGKNNNFLPYFLTQTVRLLCRKLEVSVRDSGSRRNTNSQKLDARFIFLVLI